MNRNLLAVTILPAALVLACPAAARPSERAAQPEGTAGKGAPGGVGVPGGVAVEFPATPHGRCAKAFIEMVNAATPEGVRAFEAAHGSTKRQGAVSAAERAGRISALHEEWGHATLTKLAGSTDTSFSILISTARMGALDLEFQFSATETGKLDAVLIQTAVESSPLTVEQRRATIEAALQALRDGYVYPDVARAMADDVRTRMQAGEYDSIGDEVALARRLTQDLRAVSKDRHLGVMVVPETDAQQGPMPGADEMRRHNFAFRKVEVLDGNIGYLRFDLFVDDPEARRTASAALAFLAHCDAVIFDVRFNGGGSPEMIQYITSYLFDTPTHLNSMIDRDGKVVEEYWTLPEVPGSRLRADLPVCVLTSARTFSGAEEFSYNLKNLKRATIIGETTGGGAHPVRAERLNDRFMIRVPYMRANNPISKTNWEGTGVEPDIKVPADQALDRAIAELKGTRAAK